MAKFPVAGRFHATETTAAQRLPAGHLVEVVSPTVELVATGHCAVTRPRQLREFLRRY